MINSIDLLKYQLSSSLIGLNKYSCESSNSSFDMAIVSLLESISTTNSGANVNINININNENLESILGLDFRKNMNMGYSEEDGKTNFIKSVSEVKNERSYYIWGKRIYSKTF